MRDEKERKGGMRKLSKEEEREEKEAQCPYWDKYDGVAQNLRRHISNHHPGKPNKR